MTGSNAEFPGPEDVQAVHSKINASSWPSMGKECRARYAPEMPVSAFPTPPGDGSKNITKYGGIPQTKMSCLIPSSAPTMPIQASKARGTAGIHR